MNMKDHGNIKMEEDVVVQNGHIHVVYDESVYTTKRSRYGKKTYKRNTKVNR